MSVAAVAEELGTSPQNLNAKFNRKSIKIDFFQKIKEIIDKCAPPLPAEMDGLLTSRPTLAQLQDWSQRLNNHRARLESVFSRAYQKQKDYGR